MKTLLVIVLINLFSGYCYGYTDEEFGLQIMEELDRRDSGFGDNTVETKMILKKIRDMVSLCDDITICSTRILFACS